MNVHVIETGAFAANCYLIWADPGKTFVVDPGADAEAIVAAARVDGERGLLPSDLFPHLRRLANPA